MIKRAHKDKMVKWAARGYPQAIHGVGGPERTKLSTSFLREALCSPFNFQLKLNGFLKSWANLGLDRRESLTHLERSPRFLLAWPHPDKKEALDEKQGGDKENNNVNILHERDHCLLCQRRRDQKRPHTPPLPARCLLQRLSLQEAQQPKNVRK